MVEGSPSSANARKKEERANHGSMGAADQREDTLVRGVCCPDFWRIIGSECFTRWPCEADRKDVSLSEPVGGLNVRTATGRAGNRCSAVRNKPELGLWRGAITVSWREQTTRMIGRCVGAVHVAIRCVALRIFTKFLRQARGMLLSTRPTTLVHSNREQLATINTPKKAKI